LAKAVSILQKALKVEDLDARYDVLERLRDLYLNMQNIEEAEQIEQEMKREEEQNAQQKAAKKSKVGRNDPCPCGSGKKYKKCHGAGF
jgi:preprotein translocase subunit SecA